MLQIPSAQITLPPSEARALSKFLETVAENDEEVSIQVCHGHDGYGLYLWNPEYPDEGSVAYKQVESGETSAELPSMDYGEVTKIDRAVSIHVTLQQLRNLLFNPMNGPFQELPVLYPDQSWTDHHGFDQRDMIELVMCLEDEYDIEIPDAHVSRLKTVEGTLKYLNECVHASM